MYFPTFAFALSQPVKKKEKREKMNLKANQMSLGFNQMTRVRKNQNPELAAIKWLKVKNKFKTIKKNNSQRNLLIN